MSSNNKKREEIGKCPICGNQVLDYQKSFSCSNYKNGCKFTIWKLIAGNMITKEMAKEIINTGCSNKIENFTSKNGKKFSASLVIQKDGKIGFKYNGQKK